MSMMAQGGAFGMPPRPPFPFFPPMAAAFPMFPGGAPPLPFLHQAALMHHTRMQAEAQKSAQEPKETADTRSGPKMEKLTPKTEQPTPKPERQEPVRRSPLTIPQVPKPEPHSEVRELLMQKSSPLTIVTEPPKVNTVPDKVKEESTELPLDLSVKVPKEPEDDGRKTHVFGEDNKLNVIPVPTTLSRSPIRDLLGSPRQASSPIEIKPDGCEDIESPNVHVPTSEMDKDKNFQNIQAHMMALQTRFPLSSAFPLSVPNFPSSLSPSAADKSVLSMINRSPPTYGSASTSPIHPGSFKYSCRFCGKGFPRSANLTRHLRTHTGEQPYKCKHCERSFSISSNLQRHIRNIHKSGADKPFRCHICDRGYSLQMSLDHHLQKHELGESLSSPDHEDLDDSHELEDENMLDDDLYAHEAMSSPGNSSDQDSSSPLKDVAFPPHGHRFGGQGHDFAGQGHLKEADFAGQGHRESDLGMPLEKRMRVEMLV